MEDTPSQKRQKRQNDFEFMAFLAFLFNHPQNSPTHFLKPVTCFSRQVLKLSCPGISVYHIEHGISYLLVPSPFDRVSFFLSQLELLIETCDCDQWIIHLAFYGNPEFVLLLSQFQGNIIQHLGEFIQD